jgi:hypothetical protein
MQVTLPYTIPIENITVTSLPQFSDYPYVVQTERSKTMELDDIVLRLDIALSDRDWEAIVLLMEDLREELELDGSTTNEYGDDDWAVPHE